MLVMFYEVTAGQFCVFVCLELQMCTDVMYRAHLTILFETDYFVIFVAAALLFVRT